MVSWCEGEGNVIMEAAITLNCSDYSDNIWDVIKLFQRIGWGIYDSQGKVEYLPVNDNGMYDWQYSSISESELYDIVSKKIMDEEPIGVHLFYKDGLEGISFLASNTSEIMLSLSIYRKIFIGRNTDIVWYVNNIIYKLLDIGVRLLSYEFEEFED